MSSHDDEFPMSGRRDDQRNVIQSSATATCSSAAPRFMSVWTSAAFNLHAPTLAGTAPSTPYGIAGTALSPELSHSGLLEISAVAEPMEPAGLDYLPPLQLTDADLLVPLSEDIPQIILDITSFEARALDRLAELLVPLSEDIPQIILDITSFEARALDRLAELLVPLSEDIPQIILDITSFEARALDRLAELGPYGPSADDVATYLIMRGLDDLMRAGVLKFGGDD
jgi:hypothetical protein